MESEYGRCKVWLGLEGEDRCGVGWVGGGVSSEI